MMNFLKKLGFVAACVVSMATAVQAAPIHVSPLDGGGFGSYGPINGVGDTNAFVYGGEVNAGDVITLSTTGYMCLSFGAGCNDANGVVGVAGPHISVLGNIFGAVVYAIVPSATVSTPGFMAYDSNDVAVGIADSLVQFAGTLITFTATQSGSIYFGVSDSAFWDNDGPGFDVTMTVPAPGALALLGLGLLGLGSFRRKKAA